MRVRREWEQESHSRTPLLASHLHNVSTYPQARLRCCCHDENHCKSSFDVDVSCLLYGLLLCNSLTFLRSSYRILLISALLIAVFKQTYLLIRCSFDECRLKPARWPPTTKPSFWLSLSPVVGCYRPQLQSSFIIIITQPKI